MTDINIKDRFNNVMKSFAKKERKKQPEVVVEDAEEADDAKGKDNYFKRVKVSGELGPGRSGDDAADYCCPVCQIINGAVKWARLAAVGSVLRHVKSERGRS